MEHIETAVVEQVVTELTDVELAYVAGGIGNVDLG